MPREKNCGLCGKDTAVRLLQGCLRCYVSICCSALLQRGLRCNLVYYHPERWTRDNVLAEDRGSCVRGGAVALLLQS